MGVKNGPHISNFENFGGQNGPLWFLCGPFLNALDLVVCYYSSIYGKFTMWSPPQANFFYILHNHSTSEVFMNTTSKGKYIAKYDGRKWQPSKIIRAKMAPFEKKWGPKMAPWNIFGGHFSDFENYGGYWPPLLGQKTTLWRFLEFLFNKQPFCNQQRCPKKNEISPIILDVLSNTDLETNKFTIQSGTNRELSSFQKSQSIKVHFNWKNREHNKPSPVKHTK